MKRSFGKLIPFIAVAAAYFVIAPYAFGDDAGAAVADPGFLTAIKNFAGMVPTSGVIVTVAAVVVEILVRLLKTQKPLSLLYVARNLLVYLALALNAVAKLLDSVYQASNEKVNPMPAALNSVPIAQDTAPQGIPKV